MFSRIAAAASSAVMCGVLLSACSSAPECVPAASFAVTNIRDTLAAYPELGNSLADGAQQVKLTGRIMPAVDAGGLVAGRLLPGGEVGLWIITINPSNDAFMGARPLNRAAILSMPEAAGSFEFQAAAGPIEKSKEAQAVLACVK